MCFLWHRLGSKDSTKWTTEWFRIISVAPSVSKQTVSIDLCVELSVRLPTYVMLWRLRRRGRPTFRLVRLDYCGRADKRDEKENRSDERNGLSEPRQALAHRKPSTSLSSVLLDSLSAAVGLYVDFIQWPRNTTGVGYVPTQLQVEPAFLSSRQQPAMRRASHLHKGTSFSKKWSTPPPAGRHG